MLSQYSVYHEVAGLYLRNTSTLKVPNGTSTRILRMERLLKYGIVSITSSRVDSTH